MLDVIPSSPVLRVPNGAPERLHKQGVRYSPQPADHHCAITSPLLPAAGFTVTPCNSTAGTLLLAINMNIDIRREIKLLESAGRQIQTS